MYINRKPIVQSEVSLERGIINAIVNHQELYLISRSIIDANDFTLDLHKMLYQSLSGLTLGIDVVNREALIELLVEVLAKVKGVEKEKVYNVFSYPPSIDIINDLYILKQRSIKENNKQ